MAKCIGYINIYRSGFFHKPGKFGAYDRHPGDIYATKDAAERDINPWSHYVTTVPVMWDETSMPRVNPTTEAQHR